MAALLNAAGFKTVSLADLGLEDIEETGATFKENAVLKAVHYAKQTGLVTVADDSGLEIDALGGAPGIKSKRWIGENATWEDLALAVIERMKDVPVGQRSARLRTVMSVATADGQVKTAEATIEGEIPEALDKSLIQEGYPYRALLHVTQFNKLYAELTHEEHEQVNQRRKALNELLPALHSD